MSDSMASFIFQLLASGSRALCHQRLCFHRVRFYRASYLRPSLKNTSADLLST